MSMSKTRLSKRAQPMRCDPAWTVSTSHSAVALVVDWDAIERPLGLPADGLHVGLPVR